MRDSFDEQVEFDLFKLNEIPVVLLKKLKKEGIKNLKDFMGAKNSDIAAILVESEEKVKALKDRAIEIIEKDSGAAKTAEKEPGEEKT
jgi:hypothetical protein